MTSGPKNNLDDILRRRASSSTSTPSGSSISAPIPAVKSSKFKPSTNAVASSSSTPLGKKPSLPSFSTPGFGRSKPLAKDAESLSNAPEVVDISGDFPNPGTKRRSDASGLTEVQASFKRSKSSHTSDKENMLISMATLSTSNDKGKARAVSSITPEGPATVSASNDKGKARAVSSITPEGPATSKLTSRPSDDSKNMEGKSKDPTGDGKKGVQDGSWVTVGSTREFNPFTRLEVDFPNFKCDSKSVKKVGNHDDLSTKSVAELQSLLTFNLDLQQSNTRSIEDYRLEPDGAVDIVTLQGIEQILADRIHAILQLLDSKKVEPNVEPAITSPYKKVEPNVEPAITSPYFNADPVLSSSASSSSTGNIPSDITPITSDPVIDLCDDIEDSVDTHLVDNVIPDSDDLLWNACEDFPDFDDTMLDALETPPGPSLDSNVESDHTKYADNPYYAEIMKNLTGVFRLQRFRKNQLEAILAAMSGRDVFVLMPTGGGKSLCYQLPAVCKGATTKGVSVVVSPLLSLMTNQVTALKEKNVDVLLWNSESTDVSDIMRRLRGFPKPSLLYVSPEKIKESGTLKSILLDLYNSENLARFIVDEAHCISTWGHDFREAYQCLDSLRDDYPLVPIMALTATANQVMVDDIMKRLKLKNCASFKQSFNRTNLNYLILDKKKVVDDIFQFISMKHRNETGIIYCLSRDKCEKVAEDLRRRGLKSNHFHAGMSPSEKEQTLREWENDETRIIVATIAFGMGIDKPNVRYVIHHDLPKSLDGYYQETGRAGRDQKPADCLLFYSYRDYKSIVRMINNPKEPLSLEARDRQVQHVRKVMEYCLNQSDCRRVQLLQFFGEKFDRQLCDRHCDNCSYGGEMFTQDVTREAQAIVNLVIYFDERNQNVTQEQCRAIFKGADTSTIRQRAHNRLPQYGAGKHLSNELLEQLFKRLLLLEATDEVSIPGPQQWHIYYFKPGSRASVYRHGKQSVILEYRPKAKVTEKPASKPAPRSRKPRAVSKTK